MTDDEYGSLEHCEHMFTNEHVVHFQKQKRGRQCKKVSLRAMHLLLFILYLRKFQIWKNNILKCNKKEKRKEKG
jgi:hypothetical protein